MRGFSFLSFFFFTSVIFAQTAKNYSYRGKITSEEVQVFEKADFDSPVIATVGEGQTFDISKTLYNKAFYKVRIKPGVLGYISDADIQPLFKVPGVGAEESSDRKKKIKSKKGPRRKKSFEHTRYVGLEYALIDYQEESLGGKPHSNLNFFGVKISGPNVLLDGLLPIDVNLLFSTGAPSYYEKATGKSASGFVFLGDILFQTYWPQSPNFMTYFGFGPMLKYAKFDVELRDLTTGKDQPYSLEDISVGAAFDAGIGFRVGSLALRVDYQYFWEKQMYGGFTGALQWGF